MATTTDLGRYGERFPKKTKVHQAFFDEGTRLARDKMRMGVPHKSAVVEVEAMIRGDLIMKSLFDDIFLQVSPMSRLSNFEELLYMMDEIIVAAPKYQIIEGEEGLPIGVPMLLLFDLLGNTNAGHDLFRMTAFKAAMKAVLDAWGDYLQTNDSNNTLINAVDGWFGEQGLASLESNGRGEFNATYVTPDPTAVNRGYTSWDNFFTRKIQKFARPVVDPANKDLIHSACESTVYRIAYGVKKHDQFLLKGQSYSLYDMLGGADDPDHVEEFTGGIVYRAFLCPQDYHRWRSPVDGVIEKAVVIPGTYFAPIPDDGAPADDPDLPEHDPRSAMIRSQAWLTAVAARALIFIRADNPAVGLVCFIGVGMEEVSTCRLSVIDGDVVKTGDELGMFHFGGSSHTLVFGPQVQVSFTQDIVVGKHIKVNSVIASVSTA